MKAKLVLSLLIFGFSLFAQKLELNEVTIEELKEAKHAIDTSAAAAVLFKKGETKFYFNEGKGWYIKTTVDYKIKIYKKEGLEEATQKFNYYVGGGSGRENLSIKNAYTYNLENNKVVRTKLRNEGEFEEELNENWKQKKITFPSVTVGSIIEFSYILESPYFWNFNDFYFQGHYPTDVAEYNLYLPQFFQYRTVMTGYEDIYKEKIPVTNIDYNEDKYIFKGKNLPALKEEDHVINIGNYASALKCELVAVIDRNGSSKNFALTWDDVVKTVYKSDNFGRQLEFKSYFEDELNPIIDGITDKNEKIEKILKYVQNRMTWNKRNGIYTQNGVKKAFKEKTGNVADINLILIAMLRYAGIEANPILLSTRSNGYAYFPTTSAYNYVIAGIEVPEKVIFLDATNKNSLPDIIPIEALNLIGRIVREHGSSAEIDLFSVKPSLENNTLLCEITTEGTLKGKIRRQFKDYNAFIYRDYFMNKSLDENIERLEGKYKGLVIEDFNLEEKNNVALETFSFEHSNIIESIGDKMYFSPALFFKLTENPFKTEKRNYPIDYPFPYKDIYNFSIKIPEGYSVETIPEPKKIGITDGVVVYSINSIKSGDYIQVQITMEVNNIIIPASEYISLKTLYSEVLKSHNDKIVLKKS